MVPLQVEKDNHRVNHDDEFIKTLITALTLLNFLQIKVAHSTKEKKGCNTENSLLFDLYRKLSKVQ